MALRAIVVTVILAIVLTFFVVVGIMFELGDGGILFLAMLGGAIVWYLPASFAVALPAGAFGGVLLTHVEHPLSEVSDDDDPRGQILRLALFALVLSVFAWGWILPIGPQQMNRAFARYQDGAQAEQREVRPGALPLDELIVQAGSVPEARWALLQRAARIAPSFFMPLLAGVLVMVRPRWTFKAAVGATLAVFAISVWVFFQTAS